MPEIIAAARALTGVVETVKFAEVAPAGTVTLAGTVAAALLLDRVTTAPPAGAALASVTVAVDEFPPVTVPGLSVRVEIGTGGGLTVNVAGWLLPL